MDRVASPAASGTGPPARGGTAAVASAAVFLLVVAFVGGMLGWRLAKAGPARYTRGDLDRAVASALRKAREEQRLAPPAAVTAYRTIRPSLVTVRAEDGQLGAATGPPDDPAADASLGAGVVVDRRGRVLTALHVVDGEGPLRVTFADGTRSPARVTARQESGDLAVLTPDTPPRAAVPAILGSEVSVGDEVYPVGDPLGLTASLSAGVVSGTGRRVSIGEGRALDGLLQFDAPINPGNSGGPLVDRSGHVVGIVTALANPSGEPFFVGVGFAVPITQASIAQPSIAQPSISTAP